MKRILYIISLALIIGSVQSCTYDFEQANTNQNNMEMGDINPLSMLPDILFSGADGMIYRTYQLNGELIQYTVHMYTENVHRYFLRDSYVQGAWNHLSQWASNADHMRELAINQKDDNSLAIALTMRALFVSNWTDIWGSIPFSEAFQGRNGILKPKFDSQQQVYTQLLADLEKANTLYKPDAALAYPIKDLMYAGKINKWQRFTNSLHLRLLMRLSNRDKEMAIGEKMTAMVNNPAKYPLMESNADNATLYYTNESPFIGRFGNTTDQNFTSNARKMAEFMVDLMHKINDPRLGIYAVQRNNAWTGLVSGYPSSETNASNCAELNKAVLGDYTSPYSFMRYDETQFILCEAAKRGLIPGGSGKAMFYYNNAVLASVSHWDEINPSPIYEVTEEQKRAFMKIVAYDNTLEQILEQKYIAMFWLGYEAYADYRRTGFPVLPIGKGVSNDGILPTRFVYPTKTVDTNRDNYNKAVAEQGPDNMKTPIWWSKQAAEKK